MRHAKTENWYQGTDDEGRALVARGWADARLMAEVLVARDWLPERVLLSTARRTRETWKAMSEQMSGIEHQVLEALYLCPRDTLASIVLEELETTDSLLVIGHNPGVQEFGHQLAEAHPDSDFEGLRTLEAKMPTCAVAVFEADENVASQSGSYRLVDFLTAKPLRRSDSF